MKRYHGRRRPFGDEVAAATRVPDPNPNIPSMHFSSSFHECACPKLCLVCGTGYEIDTENVREGEVHILLAEVPVKLSACQLNSLVKIDFSTIIEVEDGNEVELTIALKRHCGRECVTLQEWELEFDDVELLPFSFTYCNQTTEILGCCVYTVEIATIDVEGGNTVNELEVERTFINAIVQK